MGENDNCPGEVLYSVLEFFGETEWVGGAIVIQNDDDLKYPPVFSWRYGNEDEKRDQLIVDAVETFEGNTEWIISFRDRERLPGRNWTIMPRKFEEFLYNLQDNPNLMKEVGALDAKQASAIIQPEVGEMANLDIAKLAEYIQTSVQERLRI
jgi:hypothetical protein